MNKYINKFLTSNETVYRLARTIAQGVIGVIMANVDYIIGLTPFSMQAKTIIVALVMAVLSPIMSELGKYYGTDHPPADDGLVEYEGDEEDELC